jgi:hypothetical protein
MRAQGALLVLIRVRFQPAESWADHRPPSFLRNHIQFRAHFGEQVTISNQVYSGEGADNVI